MYIHLISVCIYIYIYTVMYVYIYIYIYIERERDLYMYSFCSRYSAARFSIKKCHLFAQPPARICPSKG